MYYQSKNLFDNKTSIRKIYTLKSYMTNYQKALFE